MGPGKSLCTSGRLASWCIGACMLVVLLRLLDEGLEGDGDKFGVLCGHGKVVGMDLLDGFGVGNLCRDVRRLDDNEGEEDEDGAREASGRI